MSNTFDEFVKQQIKASNADEDKLSLESEKDMWLEKLDQLYTLIRESLAEYIKDGSMQLAISDFPLNEDLLGEYLAKSARIIIGRHVVRLEPLGTFLIGARGRVDMTGPRGVVRFLIVPPSSRAPQIRVTVSVVGTSPPTPAPIEPPPPPATWVWKIATPPPRVTYIDLTKESFRAALMGVVNG